MKTVLVLVFTEFEIVASLHVSPLSLQTDEDVYHAQLQTIARLLNHLTKLDADKGNPGVLTKEEFKVALQEYFPQRSEEDIDKACNAAEVDLEAKDSDTLDYKSLFMEVLEIYFIIAELTSFRQ